MPDQIHKRGKTQILCMMHALTDVPPENGDSFSGVEMVRKPLKSSSFMYDDEIREENVSMKIVENSFCTKKKEREKQLSQFL